MNENSIEDIYQRKLKELVRLCDIILHKQTINGVDAEDIVQRVVVKAWEKRKQLATHQNLWGWLLNACGKECAMLMRQKASRRTRLGWPIPLSDNLSAENEYDVILHWWTTTEAKETLNEFISHCSPLEKQVFEQYYVQDKSAKETAEFLNIKLNAVNDAARRIRRHALQMKYDVNFFMLGPILYGLCSILCEGRPWQ